MAGLINDLVTVLNDEINKYSELLVVLVDKNEAIVKNNIDLLNKLTFKEQILAGAVQKLEKSRLHLVKDMAIVLNRKENELTLKELIFILKNQPEESKLLKDASVQLIQVLDDVKRMNDQNAMLINNALDYIDFSINVLQSSYSVQPPTYPNKNENVSSRSFFDSKS